MKEMRLLWAGALTLCMGAGLAFAADQAVVEKTCSACHSMAKVEAAYGAKDKATWTATVERMLAKSNAPTASAEERVAMIDWLAAQKGK